MNSPTLENNRVLLAPLSLENFGELSHIAREKNLIQYSPSDIETFEALEHYTTIALNLRDKKSVIPFIVYDKQKKAFAGCTRYMNIDWKNKNLEIGSTWIGRGFQGTGLNSEMKQLMLDYAFFSMDFEKISFRIDERNEQSKKAVAKLGAILEGVLRQDTYLLNGYKRNTCIYSILKDEWIARNSK